MSKGRIKAVLFIIVFLLVIAVAVNLLMDMQSEKKAEAIIEYRKKNGSFKTKEDLMKVRGIGKKLFESFEERIVTQ